MGGLYNTNTSLASFSDKDYFRIGCDGYSWTESVPFKIGKAPDSKTSEFAQMLIPNAAFYYPNASYSAHKIGKTARNNIISGVEHQVEGTYNSISGFKNVVSGNSNIIGGSDHGIGADRSAAFGLCAELSGAIDCLAAGKHIRVKDSSIRFKVGEEAEEENLLNQTLEFRTASGQQDFNESKLY